MIYNPNKLLTISSTLLLINSLYGFKINNNKLYRIDSISSFASIIYWLDPTNIYKRNIDILLANYCFTKFFIYGLTNIEKSKCEGFLWCNLVNILYNFTISCILFKYKFRKWYYFHFIFHLSSIAQKFIVYHI